MSTVLQEHLGQVINAIGGLSGGSSHLLYSVYELFYGSFLQHAQTSLG